MPLAFVQQEAAGGGCWSALRLAPCWLFLPRHPGVARSGPRAQRPRRAEPLPLLGRCRLC